MELRLSVDLLILYSHTTSVKRGPLNGAPGACVHKVRWLRLHAGCLSTWPVPLYLEGSGPRAHYNTSNMEHQNIQTTEWPQPPVETPKWKYKRGGRLKQRPEAAPQGQEVSNEWRSAVDLTQPPWPQARGRRLCSQTPKWHWEPLTEPGVSDMGVDPKCYMLT